MSCKKAIVWSVAITAIVALHCKMMGNSLDYRVSYLKRKLNCLNRKVNKVLNNMNEENLKKYKDEIVNGYENIKNKIDNLTIKDIKDVSSDIVTNIIDKIRNFKQQLLTYAN